MGAGLSLVVWVDATKCGQRGKSKLDKRLEVSWIFELQRNLKIRRPDRVANYQEIRDYQPVGIRKYGYLITGDKLELRQLSMQTRPGDAGHRVFDGVQSTQNIKKGPGSRGS